MMNREQTYLIIQAPFVFLWAAGPGCCGAVLVSCFLKYRRGDKQLCACLHIASLALLLHNNWTARQVEIFAANIANCGIFCPCKVSTPVSQHFMGVKAMEVRNMREGGGR
jgi:hypothetical protein